MPEYNFQLRGWHALVTLLVLLVYTGGTMFIRIRPVDDHMRDAVRTQLLNEYSGRSPRDLARLVNEARTGQPVENLPPLLQRDVQFPSFKAHGKMAGSVTYVRAEITVDGGPPPDGQTVRYFTVSRTLDGDWSVLGPASSLMYHRVLFP